MKKDIDLTSIFRWIGHAFAKFHTTLFIIVMVGGLGLAVLDFYQITQKASSGEGGISNTESINFDTQTMERLKQLHSSDKIPQVDLPEGRINPFSE